MSLVFVPPFPFLGLLIFLVWSCGCLEIWARAERGEGLPCWSSRCREKMHRADLPGSLEAQGHDITVCVTCIRWAACLLDSGRLVCWACGQPLSSKSLPPTPCGKLNSVPVCLYYRPRFHPLFPSLPFFSTPPSFSISPLFPLPPSLLSAPLPRRAQFFITSFLCARPTETDYTTVTFTM